MEEITRLLRGTNDGDVGAKELLYEKIYGELRVLARARLSRESTLTDLDAGSLVNETYLRLARQEDLPAASRRSFYAYASNVMRSVIVDYVRQRKAAKRGSGVSPVTLLTSNQAEGLHVPDILVLDEAMNDLRHVDERCCQLVEMRFFGGLEFEEIAEVLGVSRSTVSRDWEKARLFLYRALKS